MSRFAALLAVGFALLTGACETDDSGGLTEIDATGTVGGLIWLDRNGNEVLDGNDAPVQDVRVRLVPPQGGQALYSGVSGANGEFLIEDVAVGDYLAAIDSSTVGDSLRVLSLDSASLTVAAEDTAVVVGGLSYPSIPTDSARARSLDSRLFIEGRALTGWGTFADSTVHVRDSTGAILAVRVAPVNVVPGDSIRLLGTTALRAGEAVLRDVRVFLVETGTESPPPIPTTTDRAAMADGGVLDAELVRVDSAVIQDTARTPFGEAVLTVDDGSGALRVVLDRDIPFFLDFPTDSTGATVVIGSVLDATGVLVPSPDAASRWILKPRGPADVDVR